MAGGMQGGYVPPPVPVRRQGNNGLLIGSLVGCGVIALLIVVIGGVTLNRMMKGPKTKGIFGVVTAITPTAESVTKVRDGLDAYRKDHNGKYPPTLEALTPKYFADKSAFVVGSSEDPKPMEYTPPKPDAPDSFVVVRAHYGDIVTYNQRQQMSILLLKSGEVDSEQMVRTPFSKAGERSETSQRTY